MTGIKRFILAGFLVVVVIVIFLFAPIIAYSDQNASFGSDVAIRAQVSPSFDLLRCGTVYDLHLVYLENGQTDSTWVWNNNGVQWSCGTSPYR